MENFDDAPEAVLVRDGNIIAVGTLKDLKALTTPECQAISLQGKTLLPAFIEYSICALYSCFSKSIVIFACKA